MVKQLDPARELWSEEWLNRFQKAMSECDITYKELARGYMKTLGTYDYSYFRMLRKYFGDQKALELHKKTWLRNIPDYIDQAKPLYKIKEPLDLMGLGFLLKYAFNQQGCRFDITECRKDRFIAYISKCIVTEYAKERFPPDGDSMYQKSIHQIHEAMVDELVKVSGLKDKIDYSIDEEKVTLRLK
jgi:hypothetical protein